MNEMNTLQEAEKLIRQLAPEDLASFRQWFAEFDAEQWDQPFEDGVAAVKLEGLAQKALQQGQCSDL